MDGDFEVCLELGGGENYSGEGVPCGGFFFHGSVGGTVARRGVFWRDVNDDS